MTGKMKSLQDEIFGLINSRKTSITIIEYLGLVEISLRFAYSGLEKEDDCIRSLEQFLSKCKANPGVNVDEVV